MGLPAGGLRRSFGRDSGTYIGLKPFHAGDRLMLRPLSFAARCRCLIASHANHRLADTPAAHAASRTTSPPTPTAPTLRSARSRALFRAPKR